MLSWARDRDGARVNVGELDPRRREARAPFACPRCGEALVARLGRVRARHFAHRPGSSCPLTTPETALHQNVKERVAWLCGEALAGRARVGLGARCPACRRPAPVEVAALADGVELEGLAGSRRADVLLSRGGRPAVAIEVRVAHALTGEKEDDLAALGVPVIEVDAAADWEVREPDAIRIAGARSAGFLPCPACASAARAEQGRSAGGEEAAVAELEGYRARGLLGPPPGRPVPRSVPDDPSGKDDLWISSRDHERLDRSFRCPACGGTGLVHGERIVRHRCPDAPPRVVAWRGYDGVLVELGWWKTPRE